MSVNAINPKMCNPEYAGFVPEAHEENWSRIFSEDRCAKRLTVKGDFAIVSFAGERASIYLNYDDIEVIVGAKRFQKRWWEVYIHSKNMDKVQKHTLNYRVQWGAVLGFDDTANSNNSAWYTSADIIFIEDFDEWFDM